VASNEDVDALAVGQLLELVPRLPLRTLLGLRLQILFGGHFAGSAGVDALRLAIDDRIGQLRGIDPGLIPGSLLGDLSDLPERRPGGLF
jgi:hypothetical protein